MIRGSRVVLGIALWLAFPVFASAAEQWTAPTPEELAMTSIPQVPGAGAVILYKEVKSGESGSINVYVRIKILTEGGKDYANIELTFGGESDSVFQDIAGRTVHADGTVIQFTGKPYEKLVEKEKGTQYKVKVFSLPAVEVGSIIEYRFKRVGNFGPPDWYIQGDLFVKNAHYEWQPQGRGGLVAWTPILPPGVRVEPLMGGGKLALDVHDVPPLPKDEMMPPIDSISYRVLFYYTHFHTAAEFWKGVGDEWSKELDKFIGPDKRVQAAVADLISPGDTDEQKLRKIYATVMSYENTDFDRALTSQEIKAKGFKDFKTAGDILVRKRGSGDQLAILFAAMARAAGMKTYVMAVANRSQNLFLDNFLSIDQIPDYIAIVKLNGVDTYFDPGERFMPFGHLAWVHALSGGMREVDGGTEIVTTPAMSARDNTISQSANLTVDEHGTASGKVTLKFEGDPARRWRQKALMGDESSIRTDLRTNLEGLLPFGMEITVDSIGELAESERPLIVTYDVSGAIGTSTGKRLLIPSNLFEFTSKPLFPGEKREVPVDMQFASVTQDSVHYTLPAGMTVESTPSVDHRSMGGMASFESSLKAEGNSITINRIFIMGHILFSAMDYPALQFFYSKTEAHNQDTLVLTRASAAAAGNWLESREVRKL